MRQQVIDDIKKIENSINALHKEAVAVQNNNAKRQQQLSDNQEDLTYRYNRSLSDIDSLKRQYGASIQEDRDIINKLHSMQDMLPEKTVAECKPQVVARPDSINIDYIGELFEKITTDTFSSALKRQFRIGGHYNYKKMIKDFLQLIAEAEMYLLKEIQDLSTACSQEVAGRMKVAEDSHNNDLIRHAQLEQKLKNEEAAETRKVIQHRNEFFASDLIVNFAKRLKNSLIDCGVSESDWSSYDAKRERSYSLAIGNIVIPFHTESVSLQKVLIQSIPEYAFEGYFAVPYIIDIAKPLKMIFRYNSSTKEAVSDQIQLILLRMLRSAPADSYEIYAVDPNGRGNNLGVLNGPAKDNQEIGIYTNNSKDEIKTFFRKIEKEVDIVSGTIGSYESVYEYNKVTKAGIKEKIIVIYDFPENIGADEIHILSTIFSNAERCGVHIILVTDFAFAENWQSRCRTWMEFWEKHLFLFDSSWTTITCENAKQGRIMLAAEAPKSIKNGDNITGVVIRKTISEAITDGIDLFINGTIYGAFHYFSVYQKSEKAKKSYYSTARSIGVGDHVNAKVISVNNGEKYADIEVFSKQGFNFSFEQREKHHQQFVVLYRKQYAKGLEIDNLFAHHFTTKCLSYKDGTDGLYLPVMMRTTKGNGVCELVIGTSTSTHTLITGNISSGKSTFLHMIISSILLNYHPDDVELWLVDYGKVEFNQYYQEMPPHIRFISLEKSAEFTYSFLSYLKQYFTQREKLFSAEQVTDIKGYRKKHGKLSMPRILVIVDEFHNMTQHVQQNIAYREILENALAEYRKFGLSCIFSNQTVSGLQGLTDTAKLQIKNRIALSNEIAEMKQTLAVGNDNYSEDMIHRMERTSVGELWYKEWTSVSDFSINQFKGIYISDTERSAVIQSVKNCNEQVKYDVEVTKINSSERQLIPLENIKSLINVCNTDRQFTFYLGSPVTIDKVFSFNVEKRYNQNILAVGRNNRLKRDIIASTILNASLIGGFNILVYADTGDELYNELVSANFLRSKTCNLKVYNSISDICYSIQEIVVKVQKKEEQKRTLIFWFGLADIIDEFNVSPPKSSISWESDTMKNNDGELYMENIELYETDPVLIDLAKSLGISVREYLMNFDISDNTNKQANDYSYNACEDTLKLYSNGGKFNIYNFVSMDSSTEFRKIKGLNVDYFIHKIILNIPRDELFDLSIRNPNIELEEGTSAFYTDGTKFQKFRPYKITKED